MKQRLTEYIKQHQLFKKEDKLLLGISGGRDSVCLAHLLISAGYNVGFAHINYHLRGKASDEDQALIAALATEWGVTAHIHDANMAEHRGNIQTLAREIRYRYFDETAQEYGYDWILTAHHLNDRIETAMINLLRGTGIYGIAGIPIKRGKIVRPLLWAKRQDIDAYISIHKLTFREDESNAKDDYLRNRLRHHVLPLIQEHDSHYDVKMASSLDHINDDAKAISAMARSLLTSIGDAFYVTIEELPKDHGSTWLYHCLRSFGFNRSDAMDLYTALESGKSVSSNGWKAIRSRDAVSILPITRNLEDPVEVSGSDGYASTSYQLTFHRSAHLPATFDPENKHVYLSLSEDDLPLIVRLLNDKDKFRPLGLSYAVSVRKYLLEKGASFAQISNTFVAETTRGEICWIPEWQIADSYKASEDQSQLVSLYFKRNGN